MVNRAPTRMGGVKEDYVDCKKVSKSWENFRGLRSGLFVY